MTDTTNTNGTPVPDITSFAPPAPANHAPTLTVYWHVYGGPIPGERPSPDSFITFTYGPTHTPPGDIVAARTVPLNGHDFPLLSSYDHDPSDQDLDLLKPEAYK